MTIIVFDLDGTLADNYHRRHHVMKKKKDWDTYSSLMHLDKPNAAVIKLFSLLRSAGAQSFTNQSPYTDTQIVILTARFEQYRATTKDWILSNVFTRDSHDLKRDIDGAEESGYSSTLYMRKDGDYRPDHIIKLELLEQAKKDLNDDDVAFIVDDRDRVVKMWRDNGYTCLQCNYGDF